jgi:hypothetical protein
MASAAESLRLVREGDGVAPRTAVKEEAEEIDTEAEFGRTGAAKEATDADAMDGESDAARCRDDLGLRDDADARKGAEDAADAEIGDEADVENRDTEVADAAVGSELSSADAGNEEADEDADAEEELMDSPARRRRFSGAETPAGRTTCRRDRTRRSEQK